jgi:hypothetical protein
MSEDRAMPATPSLIQLARQLADGLGRPFAVRSDYRFSVPTENGLREATVPAAVFSGVTPSFNSAAVALSATNGSGASALLRDLGYLGAPLVVLQEGDELAAYEFSAPLVPHQIDRVKLSESMTWIRRHLLPHLEDALQPTLPNVQARDLVLTETTSSLRIVVTSIMEELLTDSNMGESDAFGSALALIRTVLFSGRRPNTSTAKLLRSRLSFENIPVESISELYESLAVGTLTKRELGIFYTPAWLARRLVERLPARGVVEGNAVDPACGSGTFLVCYIERMLDERRRRDPEYKATATDLEDSVAGVDVDPVALESTRLTLDILARRLDAGTPTWRLTQGDSTASILTGTKTLIGNLPFGYRTHQNRSDISTAILERWLSEVPTLDYLALILPYSITFARSAGIARERLLKFFRVDELISLPETAFSTSKVPTLAVIASRSPAEEVVVVREVQARDLETYRRSGVAKSFGSVLPIAGKDPWVISPYYSALATANSRRAAVLEAYCEIRIGLQAYGSPPGTVVVSDDDDPSKRLLEDAKDFLNWSPGTWRRLRRVAGERSSLRRPGPIDLFDKDKLIVRTLTNQYQRGRLACIIETGGVWFTDRFTGIWPRENTIPIWGLAAYLQSSLVELWFASTNVSRTLRLSGLAQLPIPPLPLEWWERAGRLVKEGAVVVNPRWRHDSARFDLFSSSARTSDWAWFDSAVFTAFGISPTTADDIVAYLQNYLTVGTYPDD